MVSKLLKNVKTDCVNLGFLGGFWSITNENLKKLNILSDFVTSKWKHEIKYKVKNWNWNWN